MRTLSVSMESACSAQSKRLCVNLRSCDRAVNMKTDPFSLIWSVNKESKQHQRLLVQSSTERKERCWRTDACKTSQIEEKNLRAMIAVQEIRKRWRNLKLTELEKVRFWSGFKIDRTISIKALAQKHFRSQNQRLSFRDSRHFGVY